VIKTKPWARKETQYISLSLEYDPQFVQPIASRYTDYAMLAHDYNRQTDAI
jgi:hypothetical protein